jgi:hypothetical protein
VTADDGEEMRTDQSIDVGFVSLIGLAMAIGVISFGYLFYRVL